MPKSFQCHPKLISEVIPTSFKIQSKSGTSKFMGQLSLLKFILQETKEKPIKDGYLMTGPPKLLTFRCHTHYCFMRKSTEHSWFRQKMSLYRILSLNILVLFSKIDNGLLKIVTRFNVTKWKLHCTRILWRFKEGDTK